MGTRIICAVLLAVVGVQAQLDAAPAAKTITLNGLVAEVPQEAGWSLTTSSPQQAVLERTGDLQRTTLSFATSPIAALPEDQAFLRFAEDRQQEVVSKLEMVSVHFNRTQRNGAPCVAYDGIYRDSSDQARPFLSMRGEICRHPHSAQVMTQVELTQRSQTKDAAYKADLSEVTEVLGTVQLTALQPDR
jgi:hypothetical protein